MAKHRNCPNCGAPYEIGENRCPFCGTAYFDLSVIDIDAKEPFYISIRVNGMLVTQLVRPVNCEVSMESEDVCANAGPYGRVATFHRTMNVHTTLSFESIPEKDGTFLTATYCETP